MPGRHIRYNVAEAYFEYDTSGTGTGPWLILPLTRFNSFVRFYTADDVDLLQFYNTNSGGLRSSLYVPAGGALLRLHDYVNSRANITFLDNYIDLHRGQIKFPAGQLASTDVNTLDDYEEGSWTVVIGGSGGESGQTYNYQTAHYIKKGKEVSVQFAVQFTAKGTVTGNVQIKGLPFASENLVATQLSVCPIWYSNLATNWVNVIGYISPNTSVINITGAQAAAITNGTPLTTTDLGNSSELLGQLTYRAAA